MVHLSTWKQAAYSKLNDSSTISDWMIAFISFTHRHQDWSAVYFYVLAIWLSYFRDSEILRLLYLSSKFQPILWCKSRFLHIHLFFFLIYQWPAVAFLFLLLKQVRMQFPDLFQVFFIFIYAVFALFFILCMFILILSESREKTSVSKPKWRRTQSLSFLLLFILFILWKYCFPDC